MKIKRHIDIEEAIRSALSEYMTTYVRPLPDGFTVPSILITAVGGSEANTISAFDVTVDSRAEDEETALTNLRNAVGIIEAIAESQSTALRYVQENAFMSWGRDPVRQELAMCTARLRVYAHKETTEV
jgi:hypothetical protein